MFFGGGGCNSCNQSQRDKQLHMVYQMTMTDQLRLILTVQFLFLYVMHISSGVLILLVIPSLQ